MAGMPDNPDALPLRRAYDFLVSHGLADEAQAIRVSSDHYGSYTSTLRRGKIVDLLNKKGLLENFVAEDWTNGATESGKKLAERYANIYQQFLAGNADDGSNQTDEDDGEETSFAYESDLRDYLAKNLHLLEQGMTLWPGPKAVEYPVDSNGRRIDILARDTAGLPVVIELKVSKGHERTIGQALYYRGRVKEILNTPSVRIFIVARNISLELATAARDINWVFLFEYRLAMQLTRIQ